MISAAWNERGIVMGLEASKCPYLPTGRKMQELSITKGLFLLIQERLFLKNCYSWMPILWRKLLLYFSKRKWRNAALILFRLLIIKNCHMKACIIEVESTALAKELKWICRISYSYVNQAFALGFCPLEMIVHTNTGNCQFLLTLCSFQYTLVR